MQVNGMKKWSLTQTGSRNKKKSKLTSPDVLASPRHTTIYSEWKVPSNSSLSIKKKKKKPHQQYFLFVRIPTFISFGKVKISQTGW